MLTLTVRHRIKYHRGNKGISVPEMAELLNMNERSYYRIESGEKKSIELELLYRISEVLHIPIEELIQGDQIIVGDVTNGIGVNIGSKKVTIDSHNTDFNPELQALIQSLHSIVEEQQKLLSQQVEIIKNMISNKT